MLTFWLNKNAGSQWAILKGFGAIGDIKVETHFITGEDYFNVLGDIFDPTVYIPDIPDRLIKKVTFKGTIYRGLRTEGIYRYNGAEMLIVTTVRVHSDIKENKIEREEYQDLSLAAPTVEALKDLYTLVRQGKLPPSVNWEENKTENQEPAPPSTAPQRTSWYDQG